MDAEPVAYRELRDPREIRAFGDALRVRILHVLIARPATNQQVASALGESPAKVYHHVCSLLDAGLIHLVETQISGRNVEKFYRAVARNFILCPGGDERSETEITALSVALDRARHDALASAAEWGNDPPRLLRRVASLSPQQLDAFYHDLHVLIGRYWTEGVEDCRVTSRMVLTVLVHREAADAGRAREAMQREPSDA